MKPFIKAVSGMKSSVIYTDIDGRHFRFFDGTWAWRNHNPGNVYAGNISKKHNQIGATHHFAIFPDDDSGHASLLDSLIATYGNMSIDKMIYIFAPPKENPTEKYRRFLHKKTGIDDNTKIKNFTPLQFEKLWRAIQQMEGYKSGKIVEIFRVSSVDKLDKNSYQYYLETGEALAEEKCIQLAKQRKLELEVCFSRLGNPFLRSPPDSIFQKRLRDIIK